MEAGSNLARSCVDFARPHKLLPVCGSWIIAWGKFLQSAACIAAYSFVFCRTPPARERKWQSGDARPTPEAPPLCEIALGLPLQPPGSEHSAKFSTQRMKDKPAAWARNDSWR